MNQFIVGILIDNLCAYIANNSRKKRKKKGTILKYRKQDLKQLGAALLEHIQQLRRRGKPFISPRSML